MKLQPVNKKILAALLAAAAFALATRMAVAGTLIPVPHFPGSTSTWITGINDHNVIAGRYDGPGEHGFVGTLDGAYTSFDILDTNAQALIGRIDNDGYVYGVSVPVYPTKKCRWLGCAFMRRPDGTLRALRRGSEPLDGIPGGIVGHEKFVGWYFAEDGSAVYGYYGKGARYRSGIDLPFPTIITRPVDFNRSGIVVGSFYDGAGHPPFILKDGVATIVNYPGISPENTELEGINNAGLIVGDWYDQAYTSHAFLYDLAANAFSPIEVPGATSVFPSAINNGGVVALDVDGQPYIYCTRKRTCPSAASAGVSLPEKWIHAPASSMRTAICRNNCLRPHHAIAAHRAIDPAALRSVLERDPLLRRELHLPAQ